MTEAAGSRIKIFLLDDHEVVRRGVRDLLEMEDDLEVVGEAGSAGEALSDDSGNAARRRGPRCPARLTATG